MYEIARSHLKLITSKETDHKRYGTQRNSSSVIFDWIGELDHKAVKAVQEFCGADLLAELGYREYRTEVEYENGKNLLGRNSLMMNWLFENKFYKM